MTRLRTPARRCPLLTVLLLLIGSGCAHAEPAEADLRPFEFVREKMGGPFRVVLYAGNQASADKAAEAVYARVDALNAALSDYTPDSEISRLSLQTLQGPMTEAVLVGDDLWRVLVRGQEIAQRTGGAFDVTVGPYMRLWRRARELKELPTEER